MPRTTEGGLPHIVSDKINDNELWDDTLLKGSSRFVSVGDGPAAGNELRLPGRKGIWIIRLGETSLNGSLGDFVATFSGLAVVRGADDMLTIDDPEYGEIHFHAIGRVSAEDRILIRMSGA